ncbi:hypothetical protein AFERRI_40009 [Acidithiobacillus ferrivorans]|uniref:Uncharacterized protein n=1 Tax=Acidithiobacillus ferrivorans TaxID=160808 RepID=A0A060UN56_9PROT|nr:hypothetical protein AFERRI_40009 [Acidithiobacillus ferrivorans]
MQSIAFIKAPPYQKLLKQTLRQIVAPAPGATICRIHNSTGPQHNRPSYAFVYHLFTMPWPFGR